MVKNNWQNANRVCYELHKIKMWSGMCNFNRLIYDELERERERERERTVCATNNHTHDI